jgi:hypothetical protein
VKYRYPWTVAFGVYRPQQYASVQQVWAYLNGKFAQHGHGCASVDGPSGRWAGFYDLELWLALAEDAEAFAAHYEHTAS